MEKLPEETMGAQCVIDKFMLLFLTADWIDIRKDMRNANFEKM